MAKFIGSVRVTQLVKKLTDPEDRDDLPAGKSGKGSQETYEIECFIPDSDLEIGDEAEQKALIDEAVLDEFHSSVAIGCLDDFSIEIIARSPIKKNA